MRELNSGELYVVAGGRLATLPPTTLETIIVRPPTGSGRTAPFGPPPSVGGGGPGGGRQSSGPAPAAGRGLTPQQLVGIARIKSQLGIDLTAYAQMSPSLAQAISLATTTYDFNFEWTGGPSSTVWTDGAHGRIAIDSAYMHNSAAFLQQIAHELGHAGWHVSDNTRGGAEHFIKTHLEGEGYATLMGERVNHEIRTASNIEISIASSDVSANRPFYDAEFAQWSGGFKTMQQAANKIGEHYSRHEVTRGMSYHDYYLSEYHRLGGR